MTVTRSTAAREGNAILELHDSTIVSADQRDGKLIVRLSPAIIHRSSGQAGIDAGSCWLQEAELILLSSVTSQQPIVWPLRISGGCLSVGSAVSPNVIPVPFTTCLDTLLEISGFDDDDEWQEWHARGAGAELVLIGDPEFPEEFR